jgi:hypothetical protein
VGPRDGWTQSAHACLFFFLHLDGLRTPIYIRLFPRVTQLYWVIIFMPTQRTRRKRAEKKKKTLILILGSLLRKKKTLVLTLGRPLDVDFRTWTWVSGLRRRTQRILRSSYLVPVTFLCVHRHFFFSRHFSLRPVVTDRRTHARTHRPREFIYKIMQGHKFHQ